MENSNHSGNDYYQNNPDDEILMINCNVGHESNEERKANDINNNAGEVLNQKASNENGIQNVLIESHNHEEEEKKVEEVKNDEGMYRLINY